MDWGQHCQTLGVLGAVSQASVSLSAQWVMPKTKKPLQLRVVFSEILEAHSPLSLSPPAGFSGFRAPGSSLGGGGGLRGSRELGPPPPRACSGFGPCCGRTKPPALTSGPLSARPAPSAGGAAPCSHPGQGASPEPAASPAAQRSPPGARPAHVPAQPANLCHRLSRPRGARAPPACLQPWVSERAGPAPRPRPPPQAPAHLRPGGASWGTSATRPGWG